MCSECSVHWWSRSPRVPGDHLHMVFSIWTSCSSIPPPHPYAQILSASLPPSSLSFAAFPTGTPCASGHLNHCDPLSSMPPCWPQAVTHLPAWTPEGCFLLACDCRPALAWQTSQLLCHPLGSTILSSVTLAKASLGENPSFGLRFPFQDCPLRIVPQT